MIYAHVQLWHCSMTIRMLPQIPDYVLCCCLQCNAMSIIRCSASHSYCVHQSGDSRPTATEPPPRETFKATQPPARAAFKETEPARKAALKATESTAKSSQAAGKTAKAVVQEPAKQVSVNKVCCEAASFAVQVSAPHVLACASLV